MSLIDPISESLALTRSYMTTIPNLNSYRNVTKLDMSHNLLSTIDITKFPPNLTTLILSKNNINITIDSTVIPPQIEKLKLENNLITKFDGSRLVNLKVLKISGNKLSEFIYPPNINHLDISDNNLMKLRNRCPQSLTYLDCSNNNFITLPILNESMVILNCSSNRLELLPALPDTLKILNAGSNLIEIIYELPDNIEGIDLSSNLLNNITCHHLRNLQEMTLENNKLREIPKLPFGLKTLCIQQNEILELRFTDIPFSVRYLDVSDNYITEVPRMLIDRIPTFKYSTNFGNNNAYSDTSKYNVSSGSDSPMYDSDDADVSYLYADKTKKQKTISEYFDKGDPYGMNNRRAWHESNDTYKNLGYYNRLHNPQYANPTPYVDPNLTDPYCVSIYNKKEITL